MDFKELNDMRLPEQSLNKLKEGIQSKLVVKTCRSRYRAIRTLYVI